MLPRLVPRPAGWRGTLPIFPSDVKARYDKMVGLVEMMLRLLKELPKARTPHDKELIERQIPATDRGTETVHCA